MDRTGPTVDENLRRSIAMLNPGHCGSEDLHGLLTVQGAPLSAASGPFGTDFGDCWTTSRDGVETEGCRGLLCRVRVLRAIGAPPTTF